MESATDPLSNIIAISDQDNNEQNLKGDWYTKIEVLLHKDILLLVSSNDSFRDLSKKQFATKRGLEIEGKEPISSAGSG